MKGYAPCWPFRVKENKYGEWESEMNPIIEWIWENFVSLFWDGTVRIKGKFRL